MAGRGRGQLLSKMADLSIEVGKEKNLFTPVHSVDQFFNNQDVAVIKSEKNQIPEKKLEDGKQEDIDWQVYKFARKIKEKLKDISEENVAVVLDSMRIMVEERPLSSRFTDVSEIKQILEVIFHKGTTDESFVRFAPCFIKMAFESSDIEFQLYFDHIVEEKRKDLIKVCGSPEILLSDNAKNFCSLMGKLLIIPRQKSTKFFDIMSPLVGELIERWTLTEGSEVPQMTGHNFSLAKAKAKAAHCLLIEISMNMISCDSVIKTRMETFVWLLRESVLNNNTPKELKEVYLDALIDIQCGMSSSTSKPSVEEEEEEEEEDEDVIIEEVIIETAVGDETLNHETKVKAEDGFITVKFLLNEMDLMDNLSEFIQGGLTDDVIGSLFKSSTLMSILQDVGFSRMVSFNINKSIESKGWETWKQQAVLCKISNINGASTKSPTSSATGEIKRSSISDRMAIAFPKTTTKMESKDDHPSPSLSTSLQTCIPNKMGNDLEQEYKDIIDDYEGRLNVVDDSSDVEIEEETEVFEERPTTKILTYAETTTLKYEPAETLRKPTETVTLRKPTETVTLKPVETVTLHKPVETVTLRKPVGTTMYHKTAKLDNNSTNFPVGRGRGMVKFPNSPHGLKNDLPVAKISPTGRVKKLQKQEENPDSPTSNTTRFEHHSNKQKYHGNKREFRKSPPTVGQFGRFQTVYHSQAEPKPPVDTPRRLEFGMVKPNMCFRCSSVDHVTEECTIDNPFF